jgi:hypothetical protein
MISEYPFPSCYASSAAGRLASNYVCIVDVVFVYAVCWYPPVDDVIVVGRGECRGVKVEVAEESSKVLIETEAPPREFVSDPIEG